MSKKQPQISAGRALIARLQELATAVTEREMRQLAENRHADFLARSVVLEETAAPKVVYATISIACALFIGFFVWAGYSMVDEKTTAQGEILPVNFVQPVQHLEGGIVAEVRVAEGQEVAAGDTLILLDGTASRAELDSLKARRAALALQAGRLKQFALGEDFDFAVFEEGYGELVADQQAILRTQMRSRTAQVDVIRAQIAQREEEAEGLKAQRTALERQVALMREELDLRKALLDKGLNSRVIYLETERALSRAERDLAAIMTEIAQNGAARLEAKGRIVELEEQLSNDALTEMGRVTSELAEVREQVARLEDRVARLTIAAPTSGRVKGLAVTTRGEVVAPGQILVEVVPQRQDLVAEVRISPRDIGHVEIGDKALLKVETYSFARHGGVAGTLSHVSASSFTDPATGEVYFKGLIDLAENHVGQDPRSNRLTAGMTLIADIKTGKKSLLGYLVRPVYNSLNESFAER